MTLDDLLQEISERGWEISLHGPALGKWEAEVRIWRDEHHIMAIGHARDRLPIAAVSRAMEKVERDPEEKIFVPDLTAIAPQTSSSSILTSLGIIKPSEPIKRRV